jgi:hypothetical protein
VGGDRKLVEFGIDPESLIEETSRLAAVSQPALENLIDFWLDDIDLHRHTPMM